jgi:prepilin signal peptidase PulO-like enzyme (type II secretory pathway)
MAVARRSLRVRVPYGPWMLLGALLAVLVGPWLARSLGY